MRTLIFVAGKIGSGKTTVCKRLEYLGFARISASDCLRRLYIDEFGSEPTRVELAEYGKLLLHAHRIEELNAAIVNSLQKIPSACIDGLRFKPSLDEVSKFSKRSLLIFLSCPPEVRKARSGSEITEREFDLLWSHETETSVDKMKIDADFIIDTSKPLSEVFGDLERQLYNWKIV
jgi:dephospho-CoA kinase